VRSEGHLIRWSRLLPSSVVGKDSANWLANHSRANTRRTGGVERTETAGAGQTSAAARLLGKEQALKLISSKNVFETRKNGLATP
jgi:hypothetical protein